MSIQTYENIEFDAPVSISSEHSNKKYKVLLISQSSTDIFLVNKLLNKIGDFKVYEAGNIKAALKVVSYMSLDLIIVDDTLPTVRGEEVIVRLNRSQMLKDVPKVMLLTENYKETLFANANFENLDFIKKPIDKMIFKSRIHSILKNQQDNFMGSSIFENMIDRKISEAKEFLKIYKSFLDIDENLLFVYDKKSNQIVESNKNFTKFFGEDKLVNRVLSYTRLLKRFVPEYSDPNYLNNHHSSIWLDLICSAGDFNFLVTLKHKSKEYTFNVVVNKMKLFKKEMYIVKLSNHNLTIVNSKQIKFQNQKVNQHLSSLEQTLIELNQSEEKSKIQYQIKVLLDELKISSAYFEKQANYKSDEINVYFVIATILKDRAHKLQSTFNLVPVSEDLEVDGELIYAKISADYLSDAVKGILESYHEAEDLKVDIKLYQLQENLKIEIITTQISHKSTTLVNKFFKKSSSLDMSSQTLEQIAPKHVKHALNQMNADLKTYFNHEQNIFLLTIPLIEKNG